MIVSDIKLFFKTRSSLMNHQIPSVEDGFKPIPLIRAFLPLLVISSIMAFLSLFTYFLIRTTEINDAIYIFFAVEGEYNFPTWFNAPSGAV